MAKEYIRDAKGDNMVDEMSSIKLDVGKSYPISYVIKELDKAPEVQLGHIVVMHEHLYHVNKLKLEEVEKKLQKTVTEGGKEYEKRGKKFVATSDVTILAIMDPLTRYEKYVRFYKSLEPEIVKGIEDSKRDSVAAPTEAIINEAKKTGIEISDEEEFLDGLGLYFKRRGINTSPISGAKYILFEKAGVPTVKKVTVADLETDEREYEKYREYTKFYEDFFKQIVESIAISKKGEIAAPIDGIIDEVKKLGFITENKEKDILRGMDIYFSTRGIKPSVIDNKYVTFKKKD
jgi:hypothetical protein